MASSEATETEIGEIWCHTSKGPSYQERGTRQRCAELNRLAPAGEDAAMFKWQPLTERSSL